MIFKMALQYILHYKMQSFAVLFSIFLSAALLTGVSSFVHSAQISDLENCREIYGDWNCRMPYRQGMEEKLMQKEEINPAAASALYGGSTWIL